MNRGLLTSCWDCADRRGSHENRERERPCLCGLKEQSRKSGKLAVQKRQKPFDASMSIFVFLLFPLQRFRVATGLVGQ